MLRGRVPLGPLLERPFRRLFAATTISTFGDAIEHIALAFAVIALPGAGATDVGLVLAARSVAGTAADAIGVQQTLWLGFAIAATAQVALVFVPSVRALRASDAEAPTAA